MIIFKDLIHYCQVGRGISTRRRGGRGTFIVVCSVETLKQKKNTRTDTGGGGRGDPDRLLSDRKRTGLRPEGCSA